MQKAEAIQNVFQTTLDLDIDNITSSVKQALFAGVEPLQILREGLSPAVRMVGERFESGEYYLTDLVLAGEVLKQGIAVLEPLLNVGDVETSGTVVLATVKGDIHEIGKNLVGTMLSSAGLKVIDLGVDVPAERIVESARKHQAQVVGLSVLLTPMIGEIKNVLDNLHEAGVRDQVKVIIGGACTTPELAEKMGCDAHGADAVSAVRVCERLIKK